MIKSYRLIIALLFLMSSTIANSSEVYGTIITGINVFNGSVSFRIEGGVTVSNQPSCAIGNYPWAFPTGTPDGKMMMSLILAAKMSQSKIRLLGSGACTLSGNKETITHILLTDGAL